MILLELHRSLSAEGGLLTASLLADVPDSAEVFGPLVASGPRRAERSNEYALVIESIFEGYLLHFSAGARIVASGEDSDLRLLCGDYMYAFGLSKLAMLGDLEAVTELADLITLCATVHARAGADGIRPERACAALWALGCLSLAGGDWPDNVRYKRRAAATALAGEEAEALGSASQRARSIGVADDLRLALIAFDRAVETGISTT
jgi:hypothetical protein